MAVVSRRGLVQRQRGVQTACFLAVVGMCGCGGLIGTAPSAFFTPAVATPPVVTKPPKSLSKAEPSPEKEAASAAFYAGPHFIKLLVGNKDIENIGGSLAITKELESKTNTVIRLSRKGEYFPLRKQPRKVLVISGEIENLVAAFKKIAPNLKDDEYFTFLVPAEATGQLLGTGGENIAKMVEASGAIIRILKSQIPSVERQVQVFGGGEVEKVVRWLLEEQGNHIDAARNILNTGYHTQSAMSLPAEVLVMLPTTSSKRLMGGGGSTVKSVAAEYNVRLVKDVKMEGPDGESVWKISGAIGDVQAAHLRLLTHFILPPKPSDKR